MSSNPSPRWPVSRCSPMWLKASSFYNRIMLFSRLSLIFGTRTIYVLLTVPLHSLQITYSRTSDACTTPLKCIQNLDYSVASKTCMTVAAAKLPHPIITTLILPHPILTAITFQYLIIMIGCPQSSHYNTALMLLHVIESLWSHQSVPMMGRSQEHSLVLNTFLRTTLHS
jgi:hypothetical protein